MKTYKVTVKLYHESFGGYDHYDGDRSFTVKASNEKVAHKRALKLANKERVGWAVVTSVIDTHEVYNF